VPDQPAAPSTVIDGLTVRINWVAPNARGYQITRYIIKIRQSDNLSFKEEPISCDGSDTTVMAGLSCKVPISTLKTPPYSISWGLSIYATVTAVNVYGLSVESLEGNGAIILTIPDAPINLVNVPSITRATKIGLSW
jgi:hypothetical protein